MWRKILRVIGFLVGCGLVLAYILYASHLAKEHRAEQRVTDLIISMADSTEMQQFSSSERIRAQLKRGGLTVEGGKIDSVDAVKISQYIARNGFVRDAAVYTTYSGEVHINIRQHTPVVRLLCNGYNSYVTGEGEVFGAPQGSAYYVPVVTGCYKPLFESNFEGGAEENFNSLMERAEERLSALYGEVVALNKRRSECREKRAELRKQLKRKKFGESEESYRLRKVGVEMEIAKCDDILKTISAQKERIAKRQLGVEARKKKLCKNYADFSNLINFVAEVGKDSFWSAEVVQFVADTTSTGEISLRLVPRSGDFMIEFGTLAEADAKLAKLRDFYDDALSHIGWERYKSIDLRYNKQVICTE
jgi:hypothetical protein